MSESSSNKDFCEGDEKTTSDNGVTATVEALEESLKANMNIQPEENANGQEVVNSEDYSVGKYGILSISGFKTDSGNLSIRKIRDVDVILVGEKIWLRGRLHTSRKNGEEQCFAVVRYEGKTMQISASVNDIVSPRMVRFISNISKESVIDVSGFVARVNQPVAGCTQKLYEIHPTEFWVVSAAISPPPMEIAGSSNALASRVEMNQEAILHRRILDLRTPANQAIFRLQAAVCKLFRDILDSKGFMEILTPKTMNASGEGGTAIFPVPCFKGKNAYLAWSQFYKQVAILGDFHKVFTIGSEFRAHDINQHEHLKEYVSLDLEMEFTENYNAVVSEIADMFRSVFEGLKKDYLHDIQIISQQYPVKRLNYPIKSLILEYSTAIQMLREEGINVEGERISKSDKVSLGQLVRKQYGTDFFVLDKYPTALKPFYTMTDMKDVNVSNSFDMFLRGEEVLSGSQRIHDAEYLEKRAIEHEIDVKEIKQYIDGFKSGCPPHVGATIGLERFIILCLGLDDDTLGTMFPRVPIQMTM